MYNWGNLRQEEHTDKYRQDIQEDGDGGREKGSPIGTMGYRTYLGYLWGDFHWAI
jgi:hypothetical protein